MSVPWKVVDRVPNKGTPRGLATESESELPQVSIFPTLRRDTNTSKIFTLRNFIFRFGAFQNILLFVILHACNVMKVRGFDVSRC